MMGQAQSPVASASAADIDFDRMPVLGDITRYHAGRKPNAVATWFEGRETTWRELDGRCSRIANALAAAGIGRGDRVAFVGKGCDEFFELLFGVAKAGAVLVPVGWRLAAPEIVQIVDDAEAPILFVGVDQLDRMDAFREGMPHVRTLVGMEGGGDGLQSFAQWRDTASPVDSQMTVSPDDVALQLYTSGTTGKPKGVMLSHRNILGGRRAAREANMPWNIWTEDDINLVAMPLGHIGGVGWGIVGFLNGAKSVLAREFTPQVVLDAIEHRGVSKLFIVPAALQILLAQPRVREIDYSRLRYMLYGASPIALDLLKQATEVFGCGFAQQYGMTETTGTVVYLPPEDHVAEGNQRMRGAGKPMPGVEIRITGPERKVLEPNEIGEIETRSIANMVGYWKQPEATAATLGADGWLRTGDAGYIDADGYLYIQDRFKDMIVSGGENVYPSEVESAIYGHPIVADVAVIGVPDEKWGEAVKAIVVLKPGAAPDVESILAFARSRVAGYKVPKSVDFIDALPRNPSGKILRRFLREPYWAGRERQVN
jgi:acyl-CoA synthetase (AMP-forming)/AMP-acid ligase II